MNLATWPNWVDLIVIIIVLSTCYNGFGRGLLTEVFSLMGAVTVTALSMNYVTVVAAWLKRWAWLAPSALTVIVFWGLFLILAAAMRVIVRRLSEVMKWERLHWIVQGMGLVLGGLRGLWWSGFILVALSSSGVTVLQQSVEERSVLGPRMLNVARNTLGRVADQFPGAKNRGLMLVPPIRLSAKST